MGKTSLEGSDVVIAGGDAREVVLAGELAEAGANVWLYGFSPVLPESAECRRGRPNRADVLIFPLPGVNKEGFIYAPHAAEKIHVSELEPLMCPGTLILSGNMPREVEQKLLTLGVMLVFTPELDELATYNAVPTAEGALEVAMRESQVTIHGSSILVTGFGRCALPLAKTLAALGAKVTVAARRREALAMAETLGFNVVEIAKLPFVAHFFDFLFNTVPAPVLTAEVLTECKKTALIVDIASAPGGTDFTAAEKLGIKSILALGLPGKVAPVTAGKILGRVYPHLISMHGKGGKKA